MYYVLGCVTLLSIAGGDQIFSGPQPGEKMTPFKVWAFSGPDAGKEIKLIDDGKDTPRLVIFVHEVTRPAYQLIRPVDHYGAKLARAGLETHHVWLTADKTKTEQFLVNAKGSLALKSPIVISLDGIEGPGNYGLNRKVTITILVAKGNKVVANFAIVQPNETDVPKVVEAVAKLMGQKAPTLQELQAELNTKPAKKDALPAELTMLMRQMIQKDNDEATVAKVAKSMQDWAGTDAARQKQLREYCQLIVDAGYGTEAAKKALAKLAGK